MTGGQIFERSTIGLKLAAFTGDASELRAAYAHDFVHMAYQSTSEQAEEEHQV
jgi:hypothetical protein